MNVKPKTQKELTNKKIEKLQILFKTHLDIGFTDFAKNIVDLYHQSFIPKALELAEMTRSTDHRFVWTTGSWLIWDFLEKSSTPMRKKMEVAIQNGDFAWHALPFTTHTELMDQNLFRYGLSLSKRLDQRFGKKTIAAKMTDVPGHTKGIIPLMAEAGIEFLHIGVNPASLPPKTPPTFRWKVNSDELIVAYQAVYGDTIFLPDNKTAVAINLTNDNHGPQPIEELKKTYDQFRTLYPSAKIDATNINEIAQSFISLRDRFPVIEDEIGDTWIHGAGTDPLKVAQFRALLRLRNQWLQTRDLKPESNDDDLFSTPLALVSEHTWGMDEKTHLNDFQNYHGQAFQKSRKKQNFIKMEKSWQEQRHYIKQALSSIENPKMLHQARIEIDRLKPKAFTILKEKIKEHYTFANGVEIVLDRDFGSLKKITTADRQQTLTAGESGIARLRHRLFDEQDYKQILKKYLTHHFDWAIMDFTKPGIEKLNYQACVTETRLTKAQWKRETLFLELAFEKMSKFGNMLPKKVQYQISATENPNELDLQISWFNKEATRLPECFCLGFQFEEPRKEAIQFTKMGVPCDFHHVVQYGNRNLSAIDGEVHQGLASVTSLDAPLLAPGNETGRSILHFNDKITPFAKGFEFNLYNNLWGTNFPMWNSDDLKFRFKLKIKP